MMENKNELVVVASQAGLEQSKVETLLLSFSKYFEEAKSIAESAKQIVVTEEDQKEEMKKARDLRLALKKVRVEVEHTRVFLKAQSVRENKAIDGMSNIIKALIFPLEEHLEKQEKFAEIREMERKQAKLADRVEKLTPWVDSISMYKLENMVDEDFEKLLESSKAIKNTQEEAIKKAEEERIQAQKKEEERQKQIALENEKLKKEAKKREAEIAKQKKIDDEKLRIEREEQAKILAQETKAREDAEAKLKSEEEAREAEKKRKELEHEHEKELEEQAKRSALLAPDKVKLTELASNIFYIDLPAVSSKEAGDVITEVKRVLDQLQKYIINEANKL